MSRDYLEDEFHGLLPFEQDDIDQAYLEYLAKGLPVSNTEKKKVLVIGCGIAGMLSATLLRKSGHDVTIVEANTRVGGRCKTFRNTPEKKYFEDSNLTAEAGAMRIPDMHRLVQYLIEYTGVEKQLFLNKTVSKEDATSSKIKNPECKNGQFQLPPATDKNFLQVNYRHATREEYNNATDQNELLNYGLDADEKTLTASKLLDKAIQPLRDQVNANPKKAWPEIIKKYGEYSMRRFLTEFVDSEDGKEFRFSENAIEMIGVIENLESRMSYSFIQSFIELAIITPDTVFWLINGGTDKFTTAFYEKEKLSEITYLNQTLKDIYRDNGNGKVKINTEVSKIIEGQEDRDAAIQKLLSEREWDEVIVAIPFTSFRMVRVWPKLSQEKRKAVRELHYDAATKILLEFRERFWETDNDIYGGGSVTDLPNRFMYYPSERMGSSKGGVMLVSYSWADDARKWDSMSDYDRFTYALENVAITHAIHEKDAPYEERLKAQQRIKDLCVFKPSSYKSEEEKQKIIGAATVSWMNNPYAFGEAAIFYPGQLELLHKHIISSEWSKDGSSEKKIFHVAGEHASLKHAWIEGAIESAVNAALIVNENELPTLKAPELTAKIEVELTTNESSAV